MRITCPACGLNMELEADPAWGILNCAECGKRIRFGEPPIERGEDDIAFDFGVNADPFSQPAELVQPITRKPVPLGPPLRNLWIAGAAGAIATAMLAVLVVVLQHTTTPVATPYVVPWDQAHRPDLLNLKSAADSAARQGKWQESYDNYQRILTLVADHPLTDPVAVAIVQAAGPGEDRAMAALVADRSPAAVLPPTIVESKPVIAPVTQPILAQAPTTTQPFFITTQPIASIEKSATTQATSAPTVALDPAQTAADNAPPLAGPPPPPPSLHAYTLADAVTDEQIGEAINKGVRFLAGQFHNGEVSVLGMGDNAITLPVPALPPSFAGPPNILTDLGKGGDLDNPGAGVPPPPPGKAPNNRPPVQIRYDGGYFSLPGFDALCVYALLNAGRAMDVPGLGENDPHVIELLERLKRYDMPYTYHRSLRAAALAVFNRTQDNAALEEDVRWLQQASFGGAYTYEMPAEGEQNWDNSNSQYGLLGVWSGAQVGKAVSKQYWENIEAHWTECSLPNGMWPYMDHTAPSSTMTCAGIVSLLVARDYLDSFQSASNARSKLAYPPVLEQGLNWLDKGDNCLTGFTGNSGIGMVSYGLYGLERVGLASGYKYFGAHDWYAEIAKKLVAEQHLNGSWGGGAGTLLTPQTLIDTAYSLLFLARGRHPILYNKLRYQGDWNNRPHDVAHLARFASQQLEQPLNWQVVNLRRNWFDWMDSPVLYISGDKALELTDHDYQSLASFANAGGLIFTHADDGSPAFTASVVKLVRKIFPKYELMQVPRDHPLYSTVYQLKNPAPLLAVSNGSRLLLIHSPTDLSTGWQLDWTSEKKEAFQTGVNLFVYAAGKSNLKNRLASTYIPEDPTRPDSNRQIARLQYAGEWDPEPYAYTRFPRYFQWETHQGITPVVVQMNALQPHSQPLAVLTGTVAHDFTESEVAAAKAYVAAGGVLMIDACGGQRGFIKSVEETLLPQAFPGSPPMAIADHHPLLLPSRAHADDLVKPTLRSFAIENGGKELPIQTIAYGKGWVIFSRLDLTTGLLGTQSWGILGYSSAYAQSLMKNAVLWAEARSTAPRSK